MFSLASALRVGWINAFWVGLSLVVLPLAAAEYNPALNQFGRPATAAELQAWDIDVRPDFVGLPAGSGDAHAGEQIWLEKCAQCHGDFADSNEVFSPLVLGSVTEQDIAVGRVAALRDGVNVRTTLMKVATVSTIWDYINRAMPWNNPKSLSSDEVYALVAYLLSLGYVIEPDFVLDQDSIVEVQARMPNRNGMTRDHGLWSVDGRPDVVGSDCVSDCDVDTRVTSSIPEYAMNDHGNLKAQMRDYGPFRGLQTALAVDPVAAEPPVNRPVPMALLSRSGCTGCHMLDRKLVGPAYNKVIDRYAGQPEALHYLKTKIKLGGSGAWGSTPMPAMPLDDGTAETIARWLAGEN